MSDLVRLSRRAGAGDLAAARRLVAELESRGRPPLQPSRWVRDRYGTDWGFVRQIQDGHKVFIHRDGRTFLGDDSGHTPLEAADMNGFWQWIDVSRPIIVENAPPVSEGFHAHGEEARAVIPTLRVPADDSPSYPRTEPSQGHTTGSPLNGALWLAAALGMPVRVLSSSDARTYRIVEE